MLIILIVFLVRDFSFLIASQIKEVYICSYKDIFHISIITSPGMTGL
jgi:hypothetical protein